MNKSIFTQTKKMEQKPQFKFIKVDKTIQDLMDKITAEWNKQNFFK